MSSVVSQCCLRTRLHLHSLVEKHDDFTGGQHPGVAIGRNDVLQLGSLCVLCQDVEVFQVIITGLFSTLDEHTDDEQFLVVSIQVVVGIYPCIPMGTSSIVVKYVPSLATVHGIDDSKLRARTAAVADGEVQLQVAQRCRWHRHLKILVVL